MRVSMTSSRSRMSVVYACIRVCYQSALKYKWLSVPNHFWFVSIQYSQEFIVAEMFAKNDQFDY